MFWWVVIGLFAAFGLLCTGMVLLGAVLGRGRGGCILLTGSSADGTYFLWLRAMGILTCRIHRVTDPALWQVIQGYTEEIIGWDAAARQSTGAEEIGRSRHGDSTGDHQHGGVSEL